MLCDGCGRSSNYPNHMTDDEVCCGSDGPGFLLCGQPDCAAQGWGDLPVNQRRKLYAAQRTRNELRQRPAPVASPSVNPTTLGDLDALIKGFGIGTVTCVLDAPGQWRVDLDSGLAVGFGPTIGEAVRAALTDWLSTMAPGTDGTALGREAPEPPPSDAYGIPLDEWGDTNWRGKP